MAHERMPSNGTSAEKGSGTKIAVCNPEITGLHRVQKRPEQRAFLRMAVFTRPDISDQALGGLIDHQRFARQGPPLGLAQLFDAMLTRFEAIAIDDLDAVARKPRGSFTTHVLNKRGKLTSAIAHQLRCCMRL